MLMKAHYLGLGSSDVELIQIRHFIDLARFGKDRQLDIEWLEYGKGRRKNS